MHVRLSSPSGQPYVSTVDWGDGTPIYRASLFFSCLEQELGAPRPRATPRPAKIKQLIQHIYRVPALRNVTVTAVHGGCGYVPSGTGSGSAPVSVRGAALRGNGPVAPTALIGVDLVRRGVLSGNLRGSDLDGYVRAATVDWGDGSPPQPMANSRACKEPGDSWTGTSFAPRVRHAYRPGNYRLRPALSSTDCAGGVEQVTRIDRLLRITASSWRDLEPPRLGTRPSPYTADCCYEEFPRP